MRGKWKRNATLPSLHTCALSRSVGSMKAGLRAVFDLSPAKGPVEPKHVHVGNQEVPLQQGVVDAAASKSTYETQLGKANADMALLQACFDQV